MHARAGVCWAVVLLVTSGCTGTRLARNSLSGRVLLDGQALTDGIVTLHGPDGATATSSIRADGGYVVDDPPLGICQITVHELPAPASAAGPAEHGEQPQVVTAPSRIPKRYERPGNGLQVDVKPGQHIRDISLTR